MGNPGGAPSHRGPACAVCRREKKKCDGAFPRCGRCERLRRDCMPPDDLDFGPRRNHINVLQERIVELELEISTYARVHNRELIYQSLLDKINALEIPPPQFIVPEVLPIFPHWSQPPSPAPQLGVVSTDEAEIGYSPVVSRVTVHNIINEWDPRAGQLSMYHTLYIVRLFLPYRAHMHFYMEIPYFLEALVLPPDDPMSLHPAIINAIYLAMTMCVGGWYSSCSEYFLQQTRQHLQDSLDQADRLTHFMWASCILASYLTLKLRFKEAYATISSCGRFALACGIDGITSLNQASAPQQPLLPPPFDEDEARDRRNLAHAIYMTDRTLSMMSGLPSLFATTQRQSEQSRSAKKDPLLSMHRQPSVESRRTRALHDELQDLLRSDRPHAVKAMVIYERVEGLAHMHQKGVPLSDLYDDFQILDTSLATLWTMLPPLHDRSGIQPYEAYSLMNPRLFGAHATYHGSVMLLNRLWADEDDKARERAFEAARSLANLCYHSRGVKGVRAIRAYALPIVHIMQAAHLLSRYLDTPETKESSQKLAICSESIARLAEHVFELHRMYPEWTGLPRALRAFFPRIARKT